LHDPTRPGVPSAFACPECGGALFELYDQDVFRFRCRTGHAYSPDTLLDHQNGSVENALWTAFRALEESAALSLRLAGRATHRHDQRTAERFQERAHSSQMHAESIRRLLTVGPVPKADPSADRDRTPAERGSDRARAS